MEINLILNENRHSVVLMCIHNNLDKKELDALKDVVIGVYEN